MFLPELEAADVGLSQDELDISSADDVLRSIRGSRAAISRGRVEYLQILTDPLHGRGPSRLMERNRGHAYVTLFLLNARPKMNDNLSHSCRLSSSQ